MTKPEPLFPTPLWSFNHPDLGSLGPLADRVLELERHDPNGLSLTNQGGWHSATGLLQDPLFEGLFRWVAVCCRTAFEAAGWDLERANPSFNNAWAMVNRLGDSTRAHLHPNSLFSGVVYLQATPGGGAIAFLDPRAGAQVLLPPLRAGAEGAFSGRVRRQPEPGLLLLFPTWLWHEVEPSAAELPRISVSFNVGMRPVPGNSEG
jgi:uncharacterized protein (TIGR02466 family)